MTLGAFAGHARTTLVWWILLFLFVLPGVLGSLSSVAAVLAALLLAPTVIGLGRLRDVSFSRTGFIFAGVFAALAAAFAISAREPGNVLFALDFLALPLAPVVALAFADQRLNAVGRQLPMLCAVGAVLALAVAANDVFLLGRERAVGFIAGGNLLARVALLLGAVALAGALLDQSRRRLLYLAAFVAAFAAAFLTGSRGAMMAVPVMLAAFGYALVTLPGARRPWLDLGGLVAALAATFVALSLVSAAIDSTAGGRLQGMVGMASEALNGGPVDGPTSKRLEMSRAAVAAFRAAPIVGHGWANLAAAAQPSLGGRRWFEPGDPHFQFHSDIANMAVAAGAVGILAWLALLAAPLAGALAGPRDGLFRVRLYAGVMLGLVYLVYGITDMNFGYDLPTTLYAFVAAVLLGAFSAPPAAA